MYGDYFSSELPEYIPKVIREISNERWKKFLTLCIVVRHNHAVAARQSGKVVYNSVKLMNVTGVVGAVDAPDAPFQKEFFDTINFVDAPRPPEPAPPPLAPAANRSPSPVRLPRHEFF